MFRITYTILFLWVCMAQVTWSQQLPLFTQYQGSQGIINPAAPNRSCWRSGGLTTKKTLNFGHRSQWIDQDIARTPVTQYAQYEQFSNKSGLLLGTNFTNDQAGRFGWTGAYVRIAYWMKLGGYGSNFRLGAGLNLGGVQYRLDLQNYRPNSPIADPLLQEERYNQTALDAGLGIFVIHELDREDIWYAGLSIPQTMGLNISFTDSLNLLKKQHFYGNIGYIKKLDDGYSIELSSWVKYVLHAPINVDVNLRFKLAEHLLLGVGWNTSNTTEVAFGLLLGEDNQITIGGSMDIPLKEISVFGKSFEINMTYAFGGAIYDY